MNDAEITTYDGGLNKGNQSLRSITSDPRPFYRFPTEIYTFLFNVADELSVKLSSFNAGAGAGGAAGAIGANIFDPNTLSELIATGCLCNHMQGNKLTDAYNAGFVKTEANVTSLLVGRERISSLNPSNSVRLGGMMNSMFCKIPEFNIETGTGHSRIRKKFKVCLCFNNI